MELAVDVESMLRSSGIYPTPQRVSIGELLFARKQHLTAEQIHEQIHERVSQRFRRVSKATVYNTLALFVSKGLLRELVADPARTFYDSNTQPHHHFFNIDTGELSDIPGDQLLNLPEGILPEGTKVKAVDIVVRVCNR